jgi:hypothetical protein
VVELAVVMLPEFRLCLVAGHHPALQDGQLVVSGHDPALPLEVAGLKGERDRIALKQEPHGRDVAEAVRRDRCDLEAPLPFGNDQALRREPAEYLPERADARAIGRGYPLEPEP